MSSCMGGYKQACLHAHALVKASAMPSRTGPVSAPLRAVPWPTQPPLPHRAQDMTALPYLHEPGVLWNLQSRYTFDGIYTYTGSILIAVNPFANLAHLYGTHMMDQYR